MSRSELPFPAEDAEASRLNKRLQRRHPLEKLDSATRGSMDEALQEALRSGAGRNTEWIYFESPAWTWEHLCGRAGWLLLDPDSGVQHEFLLTVMN